tara:strand:- start:492 stop:794 length:303 start_codon:yes stop_codon:yes gene_type:complete
MSLTIEEATNFFNFIEKSSNFDNKITKSDLEKALAVDTDGDGQITNIVQSRVLPNGSTTTWTEQEILDKNVNKWIQNASEKWTDDQAIDLNEFLQMVGLA